MINIGLLGCGTVGQGILEIINERKNILEKEVKREINISKILVRDLEKYSEFDNYPIFTTNIEEIVEDKNIDLIIEVTGNIEEIYPYILKSMDNGKNIITANKALVSKYMEELISEAEKNNVKFHYDATVGGAIPIIEELKHIVALNDIKSVKGVLNGTCNFILSKMEEGMDYNIALKEAQDIGFAEADPKDDVEGFDTMRKIRILSTIAFNKKINEEEISLIGINKITKEEVEKLKPRNERFKLVATALKEDGEVIVKVEPTIVKKDSILGGLINGENAVVVEGNNCGELVFKGPGAGGRATGFSILSDLLKIYK